MQLTEIVGGHEALVYQGLAIAPTNGAALIAINFSNPLTVAIYVIWLAAIWFHLSHGFWSALHTIGWNGKNWIKRLEVISNVYTTIIVIGFIAVPLLFLAQSLIDSNFVLEYVKSTL
jgi:succinate dehydrogenase / fumarate reductase cytochrome b subunit